MAESKSESRDVKLHFGTKAETLSQLQSVQSHYEIPATFYFTKSEWLQATQSLLHEISKKFSQTLVAVRSSALHEDGVSASCAGQFDTILNVDPSDKATLRQAIEQIFSSYQDNGQAEDQVLIQQMVQQNIASGVIMTRAIEDGAPYYVINYDDNTGRTDTITGGTGAHKTVIIYREAKDSDCDSQRVALMLKLARELEKTYGDIPLDIEFAIGEDHTVYLFQVRQIANAHKWEDNAIDEVTAHLKHLEAEVERLSARQKGLYGETTIFGHMPDWNPAEIIGTHPSPLAASLYRKLITSKTWHVARSEMGYISLPDTELMVLLAGSPYIDVRASFNSFLPDGLDGEVAEKLINAWLNKLYNSPELHDKVEFEIVPTVYDLDFDAQFQSRYSGLLSAPELGSFAAALRDLTKQLVSISPKSSLISNLRTVDVLAEKQQKFLTPHATADLAVPPMAWMAQILEDCISYGTKPFSVIARHGFIAESLLRSLVRLGALDADRLLAFKASLTTVLSECTEDSIQVNNGTMSQHAFLEKYGHLRPGTYDILSKTYKEDYERYGLNAAVSRGPHAPDFELTAEETKTINRLFAEQQFDNIDAASFFEYARTAIVGREHAKFVFTKSLSAVLDRLVSWGSHLGIDRDSLSLLEIDQILAADINYDTSGFRQHLSDHIAQNQQKIRSNHLPKIGYLIRDVRDLHIVPIHRASPNFITQDRVEAPILHLDSRSDAASALTGKIICIENADPGFDWIFSHNIAGLITKYGGVNSHMAIRCAEMAIPAAIGCGEITFSSLLDKERAQLLCKEKIIRV